jgi:carboxynorspermidine decarboxylase
MTDLPTPYYLLDERRLERNLHVVEQVRARTGTRFVLALKCFSTWSVFPLVARFLDGTTSSSAYEARLGHERFGGETHAYSVAFDRDEVAEVASFADKVIFNSASQLEAHRDLVTTASVGVRVNPGISTSSFDLADPARRYSRLGIAELDELRRVAPLVEGVMFHFNCENPDLDRLVRSLELIGDRYADVLAGLDWVSLGGGIAFTDPGYPLDRFCETLDAFASRHGVQLYLEPGEAVVTGAAELVTTVLDVVHNEVDVAVVDASVEAHMLDHLIYGTTPRLSQPSTTGDHRVMVAGRTCLAGDVFGDYHLAAPLSVGDEVRFADAAGYTMVKTTWFNGLRMPSIVVRRLDGTVELVREHTYDDFVRSLS